MAEACFYAVLVGVSLGFVYDVFRLFRLALNDKFFFDLIFWLLTSIVVFCYLLVFNNGNIRALYVLMLFIGFLLYIMTLGYVTKPVEIKIAKKIKTAVKKIKQSSKNFKKVLQSLYNIYYNIGVSLRGLFKVKSKGDKNERENSVSEEII